jgi:hypothetical protein
MSFQLLLPFETVSAPAIELSVKVDRRDSELRIFYEMTGAVQSIALPLVAISPERRMELWEMTCFEFFLGVPGQAGYWEVNLSPAGHWNVFRLEGYRSGLSEFEAIGSLPVLVNQSGFSLETRLDLDLLGIVNCEIELSVTAVIASKSGDVSYWALCHAGNEADFHLRDSFVMAL